MLFWGGGPSLIISSSDGWRMISMNDTEEKSKDNSVIDKEQVRTQRLLREVLCTLVFLRRGDTCEFGVDLVVFGDLQHGRAVLDDPGQEVRPPRDLKDVLYVG